MKLTKRRRSDNYYYVGKCLEEHNLKGSSPLIYMKEERKGRRTSLSRSGESLNNFNVIHI
jgi:hypothetical protein